MPFCTTWSVSMHNVHVALQEVALLMYKMTFVYVVNLSIKYFNINLYNRLQSGFSSSCYHGPE